MSIGGSPSPSSGSSQYAPSRSQNVDHDASRPIAPISALTMYASKLPEGAINSFCGALAGVASGIVTCPLDVIKTKLQAQSGFRRSSAQVSMQMPKNIYSGMLGTARVIWQNEGLRGMYRGLGPMLLGYFPTWAVYMSVYDTAKEVYYKKLENKGLARISASVTAGACSTLTTNPIWVIKTRLMSQPSPRNLDDVRSPWHYKSTIDCARKMYRTEGIRSFYSGLAPALLGLTHVAIQFPLYEYFKTSFTGLEMGQNVTEDANMHFVGIAAATFLSKICATSATYPHEVLRTRLQTQHHNYQPPDSLEEISFRGGAEHRHTVRPPGTASSDGMINLPKYRGLIRSVKTILREEGWRAFYNGMGTNMVRAIPAAMTTMLTYETLKTGMYRLREEGRTLSEEDGDDV